MARMAGSIAMALLVLSASAAIAAPAPKVAIVYSSWGSYAFRDEFDGHLKALGWPSEKFENTQIDKLIGRLDEFDMVICTGVANLEHTQDMAPWKEQWLAYLRRGGSLIVTDASYGSVLDQWTGRLGPDFALTSAGCAPYTKAHGSSDAVVCDPADPLLHSPVELAGSVRDKGGIWAHIDAWGPAWHSLVRCADEKSLLVARGVGSGSVVVTSYFRFGGDAAAPFATGLLTNVWARTLGLRSGVELVAMDLGPAAPGKRTVAVRLRRTDPSVAAATLDVTVGSGAGASRQAVTRPFGTDGEALLAVPATVADCGAVPWRIDIRPQGKPPLTLEQRMEVPAAVRATLSERHVYPSAADVHALAELLPPLGATPQALVVETRLDGTRMADSQAPGTHVSRVIYLKHLALGKHVWSATLKEGGAVLGEASVEFWRHGDPAVGVRSDGTILVGGKPFFPFGWYHVSWAFDADHRLRFLRDVAAGGFNTVHAGIKAIDEWEPFLDEARKLGVKVVTEFGTDPLPVIARYKNHPAVLAWNPGDEPDGGGISASEMAARGDRFKLADPGHPTYMTLCVASAYARYAGSADIIAPDPYPLPNGPTSVVHDCISAARTETSKYSHGLIAILQCFGYPDSGWSRVPSFEEVRNMTYLSLLAGAKGIIYYVYDDGKFNVRDHPELWAAMKTLPREIAAAERYVLNGTRAKIDTGRPDLFAGTWRLGKRTLVCVVNTNAKADQAVKVALPGKARSLAPLLPDMKTALTLNGAVVSGTLPPLGVYVGVAGSR